jgi:hypothetical protein
MQASFVAAIVIGLGMASSLHGQGLSSRTASPADVETLDGIIAAFYDVVSGPAGQARDWARDSTLYSADVRFVFTVGEGSQRRWVTVDHAQYAQESSPFLEGGFFEREMHRVVRRFADIAHVFSTYEWSSPTEQGPQHGRGINSIELIYDQGRWWITYAQWQSETPDHPIPEEYLPRGTRSPSGG